MRRDHWRRMGLVSVAALSTLLPAPIARTQRAEPDRLLTVRGDVGSPTAMDLGGPRRDGVLARTFAGERHQVTERVALPGRRASAPVEWIEGRIAVSTPEGVLVRMADGEIHSLAIGGAATRPVVLPSNDLLVITADARAVLLGPDLRVRAETRGVAPGGTLVLPDGSFVVASRNRTLVRFDPSLRPLFATSIPSSASAGMPHPPASLSPTRILVAAGERLHVLDLSGQFLSSLDIGDRIIAAPVVDRDGHVHVLVQSGQIVVADHGRHVRARLALSGRGFDTTAVLARDTDGSYRVAVPTLGVLAIDADGSERWVASTDAPFHGPLAIDAAHTTLAFDRRGRLGVVSSGGELLERIELGGIVSAFPMIASDGTLWASTDASELVHVERATRPVP
jgi:hypothetical protein